MCLSGEHLAIAGMHPHTSRANLADISIVTEFGSRIPRERLQY